MQVSRFFAPLDTKEVIPLTFGEEDKMSLRISPFNLGAPVNWFRKYWNCGIGDGKKVLKLSDKASAWNENLLADLMLNNLTQS